MRFLIGLLIFVGCAPAFASVDNTAATFKKAVTVQGTLTAQGSTVLGTTSIGAATGPARLTAGTVASGAIDVTTNDITGTLPENKGGTNQTSYTNGQLLIGNTTTGGLSKAALTGGSGITVTNAAGSITITPSGPTTSAISAFNIDWYSLAALGGIYTKTLAASGTVTFSNKVTGACILARITNTSIYTLTWPTVKWHSATAPTQTSGATTDMYSFCYDGTDVFGNAVQDMH